VAVWSAAGAWEGLTTVLWLTEQPETKRQTVAASAMEAIAAVMVIGAIGGGPARRFGTARVDHSANRDLFSLYGK